MPTSLLALTARVTAARAAVTKATTEKARETAMADLEGATRDLALAQVQSKTVKHVTKEERYEEADDESAEEEEKDDEPKKPMAEDSSDSDASGSSDSGSSDSLEDEEEEAEESGSSGSSGSDDSSADEEDEDEEEDDEDDEEAKEKAVSSLSALYRAAKKSGNKALAASAKSAFHAAKRAMRPKALTRLSVLAGALQQATGKKSTRAQLGALAALAANQKTIKELGDEVKALKVDKRRGRVDTMLRQARKDGKITSKERDSLRADGLKLGTKWLKAHLDGRAKVRTTREGGRAGAEVPASVSEEVRRSAPKQPVVEDKAMTAYDLSNLNEDQKKILEMSRQFSGGVEAESFLESMNKNLARRRARTPGR